ncbi:hypothetical protein C7435_2022 [Maricaulis maris]|uniref:DUF1674 domain-containing protein n=2 Tax=Maricaulis maris TaxID=74318 RepID=A0A495D5J3_9PROT|nr:hypothetical protein C7435_2022 [Maricaulis maris]
MCLGELGLADYLDGMTQDDQQDGIGTDAIPSPDPAAKILSPAAERALAEAAERRAVAERQAAQAEADPTELGGRKGPEPTRYGDWEKKGIICDF